MNTQNHIFEIIETATGRMQKKDLAESLGIRPDQLSRQLPGHYERAIKQLQAKCKELQDRCNSLQESARQSQEIANSVQVDASTVQEDYNRLQEDYNKLQGRPKIIQVLASPQAIVAMLILLAAFEIVGSFHLLQDKGILLALPVSIALGFGLLVFTARGNTAGKLFCVSYALAIGAIFFELLPFESRNVLFAFVPPTIAALIAFSQNVRG
jgi:FtsZ-binding cell division protein ZapB